MSVLSLTSFAYADSIQVDMAQGTASNQDCGDQCFIPSTVNIKVGDTITWQNKDSAAHTATANDGSFDTSLVNAGASSSRTFNTAGSYPYICILHPWMKGTVIVGDDIYEKARLARENYTPEFIIKTELPLYDQGDTVKVSGFITNLDANNAIDVTLRVVGPITNGNSGNIVSIDNIKPNTDGSFESTFIVAGDRWIKRGDYKVMASYGSQKAETIFFYNGAEESTPPIQCEEGQIIINGNCVTPDAAYPSETFSQQSSLTDKGTLRVSISVEKSKLKINFLNPQTNSIQEHIDYTLLVTKDGRSVFGPTSLTHTSLGSAIIPVQFVNNEEYEVNIGVEGILFRPIPRETVTFTEIIAGTSSDSTYQDPIIVFTDEDHYGSGDVITIFGEVGEKLIGYDVTFQLINSNGDLVTAQQLPVSDDDTFGTDLTASGPLWRSAGTYTVKVLYGTASRSAETTFEFSGSGDIIPSNGKTFPLANPYVGSVGYSISGGKILNITPDSSAKSLIVEIETISDGKVKLILPRNIIDSRLGADGKSGEDDYFLVLVDGAEANFEETTTSEDRTLTIPFESGTNQIDIIGTAVTSEQYSEIPSDVTILIARGTASNQDCSDQCFAPSTAHVIVGGTVTWKNVDWAAHTTTESTGTFDSSIVMAGGEFSHTFAEAGEFDYICIVHPWMKGTVIVGQGVPNPNPNPTPDIELFVNVDKSEYDLGELATLNVHISDVSSPQNVAITVTDPFGAIMISRTLTTDFNGNANTDFKIAESFKTGIYRIDATSSINGETYSDISEFRVTSQFNQIQIVSAQGTDQQGNPVQFSRGAMGFVKVQVNAQKPIATLITVNVFDSDLTPLGVGSLKTTLNTGQSELILSFMIPQDAVVGTADIYVNALSDWVSAGGIPQTGEFAGQVKIN